MLKFFRAFASFSFFTLISRIFGVIRDIVIAKKLGAGETTDIFFVALKFPNFFRRIFAEGALSQAFIPIYSSLQQKDEQKSQNFADNVLIFLILATVLLTIIVEIFTPQIMGLFAPGFTKDEDKFAQIVEATRITFPYLFLIAIVSFYAGILYVHNSFSPGAIVPIIFNFGLVATISFFITNSSSAVITLSYALIITGFVQIIFILIFIKKRHILVFPKRKKGVEEEMHNFLKRLLPAAFAASIVQLNSWVDTIFASNIPNSVSYLYYTDRLVQLPLALIGTALGIVLLPEISKSLSNGDSKRTTENAVLLGLFLGLPAAISLSIFASEIIQTLFKRGEFTIVEVEACMKALQILAIALPAYILLKIIMPHFHARGDMKTPLVISLISVVTNIILNYYLMQIYSYLGIVAATAISSWLNYFLLHIIARNREYISFSNEFFLAFFKNITSLIIMAIHSLFIAIYFEEKFKAGGISSIIALTILISAAIFIYFLSNYLLFGHKKLKRYLPLIRRSKI